MWFWIAVGVIVMIALIGVFIRFGYRWPWTGFGETSYRKPNGELEVQPKKTLWDWLQLLGTLAIPVVLAAAGFWFTSQQEMQQQNIENQRAGQARKIENQRAKAEQKLAEQRAQDETLQAYLGQMGSLLLNEDLRASKEGSEMRTLAQARTLTVLERLDPTPKKALMNFLEEADLIQSVDQGAPVIALAGADLSDTDLSGARLSGAILSNADLDGANLHNAFLDGADLSDASLIDANLEDANLNGAVLNNANLSDAKLKHASLGYAILDEAALSNAHLVDAYLGTASLWRANLSGALLSDAYLEDANLSTITGIDQKELEEQDVYSFDGATMPNGDQIEPASPPQQTKPEKLKNLLDDKQFGPFLLDQSASGWDTEDARDNGAVNGVLMFYRTRPNKSMARVAVSQFTSADGAKHKGLNKVVALYQTGGGYRVAQEFPVTTSAGETLGQAVRLRKSNATDVLVWTNAEMQIVLFCEQEDRAGRFYQDFAY